MKIRFKSGLLMAALTPALMLVSCDSGGPEKELNAYIASLKSKDSGKTGNQKASAVVNTPPASTKYQSKMRRSPFEVREITNTKGGVVANPLQAYPLDMLRFVGTVTQNGNSVAFITAPDSRVYQIKVGDIIGDRQSKVATIDEDRISLVEQVDDEGHKGIKRVVTIKLKESSQ